MLLKYALDNACMLACFCLVLGDRSRAPEYYLLPTTLQDSFRYSSSYTKYELTISVQKNLKDAKLLGTRAVCTSNTGTCPMPTFRPCLSTSKQSDASSANVASRDAIIHTKELRLSWFARVVKITHIF